MQTFRVYLDDERKAPEGWIKTTNVKDTIALLKKGKVLMLSLDHDLGTEEETGYDVIRWIEDNVAMNNFIPPLIIEIHSANAAAFDRMIAGVNSIEKLYGKNKRRNVVKFKLKMLGDSSTLNH